ELCLTNTYFSFAGRYYKQSSGTAMGAAVSVTVANLTMEAIEQKALSTFSSTPTLFLRYVDDCFCVAKTSEVDRLHKHLNSIHPDIQFTVEHESNGCLPFLDVSVEKTGNHLSFQVYRKATHTGRYLKFSSDHPTTHKSSVVSALFRRALTVCSTKKSLKMEVDIIKRDLRKNNYPTRFVNKIYKQLRHPPTSKNKNTSSRMCVPYLHGTSEVLARVLRPYGIAVTHKPVSTLGHFLPLPKDRPPKEKAQGLIYQIPCAECDASYVGETKNFPERLRRHKYDVKKKDIQGSALAEHAQKTCHVIGFDSSSILDTERNWRKRLLIESWHIQNTSNNLNRSTGTLPSSYIHGLKCASHRNRRGKRS
ncbi:unnamed protein product, partial [Ixodes persulcatus]